MVAIKRTRSYVAKPNELNPRWHLFDASVVPLGRMAGEIATILQGKHRPTYTATINTGDFVVVVNSAKVNTTGKKREQKEYHFHSGYQGGLRTITMDKMLGRTPQQGYRDGCVGNAAKDDYGSTYVKAYESVFGSGSSAPSPDCRVFPGPGSLRY